MTASTKSKPGKTSATSTFDTDGLLPEDATSADVSATDISMVTPEGAAGPVADDFSGEAQPAPAEPASASTTSAIQRTKKLTGEALKTYAEVNQGQGLTAEQLAIGAGYVRKVQGQLVAAPNAYSAALAIAFGLAPQTASKGPGSRPGRSLNYRLKSNAISGNVMVTGAYSRELGVAPGTVFTVIVDRENGELVLQPQVSHVDEALAEPVAG